MDLSDQPVEVLAQIASGLRYPDLVNLCSTMESKCSDPRIQSIIREAKRVWDLVQMLSEPRSVTIATSQQHTWIFDNNGKHIRLIELFPHGHRSSLSELEGLDYRDVVQWTLPQALIRYRRGKDSTIIYGNTLNNNYILADLLLDIGLLDLKHNRYEDLVRTLVDDNVLKQMSPSAFWYEFEVSQ